MTKIWSYDEYVEKVKPSIFIKFYRKRLNRIARLTVFPQIRYLAYQLMGIHIGKNVFIGSDCYFDDTFPELISIEDNVTISFRVTIAVHGEKGTRGLTKVSPVLIHNNAYIGTNATILPGVEIGKNAVVGAGAVVTKSVKPYTTVCGVPAKIISQDKIRLSTCNI